MWPTKPYSFVREANWKIQFQTSGGTGIAPIGEAFVNFGYFGLIFEAILAGVVFSITYKLYKKFLKEQDFFGLIFVFYIAMVFVQVLFITPGITHNTIDKVLSLVYFAGTYMLYQFFLRGTFKFKK